MVRNLICIPDAELFLGGVSEMKKEPDDLLPIGVIAKAFGVNESRIRRMEAAGLLTPARVSNQSNYRYYDQENIFQIAVILTLKSFGFVNEDIREHLTHPNDFSFLYNKLLAKQEALALLIDQFSNRIKNSRRYQCDIVDYSGGYYYAQKIHLIPALDVILSETRSLLFRAVKKKLPVDYSRAPLMFTDCTDYRTYWHEDERDLTFCIPLRSDAGGDDVLFFPACKTLSLAWNHPMEDYPFVLSSINNMFAQYRFVQNGFLCATLDVANFSGRSLSSEDAFMHILVPIKESVSEDAEA